MVDVDRRMIGLNKAHLAGLRRLSARALAPSTAATTPTLSHSTLQSFNDLSAIVKTYLVSSKIKLLPGLSDDEFAKLEAEFNFQFPPDIRAILSAVLPTGPGFPDWRSKSSLKQTLNFPVSAASIHILKNRLWSKSWGARPSDLRFALKVARAALKRAPLLIPIFKHCYIPCSPSIAGNPIFFVDENQIFICGFDLFDFFQREYLFSNYLPEPITKPRLDNWLSLSSSCSSASSSSDSRNSLDTRTLRWIEFWSEAASENKRRNSNYNSNSSASPSSSPTKPKSANSEWIDEYIATQIKDVLLKGGWKQNDVAEIVSVSASDTFETEHLLVDHKAVFDALLVKVDKFSDSLRKGGWSSEEVSEVLRFEWEEKKKKRRPTVKLSPELVEKVGKLLYSVGG